MADSVRIDKWLWAVRVFKPVARHPKLAKRQVVIGDLPAKPSRMVHVGEVLKVRKAPITKSLKVLALAEKRMGAKLIVDFVEDVTPAEELDLLEIQKHMRWSARDRGTGRPTKKDRRELDDFFDL